MRAASGGPGLLVPPARSKIEATHTDVPIVYSLVEVNDVSPRSLVVVDNAHTATDCLGDVGRVRTSHASWIKPSISNRISPPRACIYQGITRTRNFREFCTTSIPVQTASVIYPGITRTRNFGEFCTTSVPVQTTSMSSVRHSYPYPERL